MLTEAIAAVRTGNRPRARELLSKLLRADSGNVEYWLWMSSVVDTRRERVYCLESALRLDPTNRAALRGLVVNGARNPSDQELNQALKIPIRKISPAEIQLAPAPAPAATERSEPHAARPTEAHALRQAKRRFPWQMIAYGGIGIVAVVGVMGLIRLFTGLSPAYFAPAATLPPKSPTATATALPGTSTATPIPAATRALRTPVPTEFAATPLALLVSETRTPTPVAGYTPRPNFEAYESGIRALDRGDYSQALFFFDQVNELDSSLPDVHYFRGEAYRLEGEIADAIREYDRAWQLNPDYAPLYLGRGRALLDRDGKAAAADIEKAIAVDPGFVEAYETLGEYYEQANLWSALEQTMEAALEQGARSPRILIHLSNAKYNLGKYEEALLAALEGSADDPTLLPGYLAIGRAYVALGIEQVDAGFFSAAIWPLQTYVAYSPDDYRGWGALGRALVETDNLDQASDILEIALALKENYATALLARGRMYMKLGLYEAALKDMLDARRYGTATVDLLLSIGKVLYLQGDYNNALRDFINPAIAMANELQNTQTKERLVAEGYALRALIYETNPDNRSDAIREWRWILDLENAHPDTRALAQEHILELTGEGPTRTPTPSPTPTATEATPTETPATPTPTRSTPEG